MTESDLAEEALLLQPETVLQQIQADPAALLTRAGKPADPWQAEFLSGSPLHTLLLCSRQAGKSTVAAALALKQALLVPDSLVLLLSPTLRQSGELFRDKVLRLYNALGRPVPALQESALQMTLANGSRIISLPGDEETIRGYSGVKLLIIDEAARVPDELYKSVRPMLAVSRGRLVALSTPFGKQGWFYKEWLEGPWQRIRITALECPRIPPEFLEEELRTLGEEWYAQEYLCEFRDGSGSPLFPSDWLERAVQVAATLPSRRVAKAMGVDSAEGGDRTVWVIGDELGIIYLLSLKTPDTTIIPTTTIRLLREYGVPPERCCFDRGGGGKEHVDRLRKQGFPVQSVGFGEAVLLDLVRRQRTLGEKIDNREERSAYKNRRAQMYGEFRELLNPYTNPKGFGIPAPYAELRRQLAPIPQWFDEEDRLYLPPKHRKSGDRQSEKQLITLDKLIGCSPDEADAAVLMVHALLHASLRAVAGAR